MRLPSIILLLGSSLIVSVPSRVAAHPGGLNAEGCHNNRKTGEYHCHGSGGAPSKVLRAISGAVSFRNCSEARAAGAAPIYRGQPGYAGHLDRDGDGIACEPYRGR